MLMCADEQKTILLVEDSATCLLAEAARLRGSGYKVIIAASGKEAVELAVKNKTISLILMDIELGEGLDGTEAARQILAVRHLPIVFLTAHTEKEYIDRLKTITRYGVVAKNSGEFILQSSIEMALELFEAELKIEKPLSLLTATLESTNDAILVVDLNNTWVLHNQKFIDLWHITDEIIAARDDDAALSYVLDQLEDADGFLRKVRELYATPDASSFDTLKFKNGKVIERYSQPQRIDGKVAGRVWSFRDVTERRQAEYLLFASEYKYRTLVELAGDAIFLADVVSGAIIDCNMNASKLIGKSKEEIIGIHQSELHPHDKVSLYREIFREHIETGRDITEDVLVVHKDGYTIPVDIHATVLDLDGAKVILGIFRDITERKKQADELKRTKKRYDLATSIGKVGIWSWNPATGNVVWNDQTFRILGFEPGEVRPSFKLFLDMLLPEDKTVLNDAVQAALRGKKPLDMDCRIVCRSGEKRICHTTGEVELNEGGEAVRLLGTFQDVTESKRAENALRESEELLRSITDNATNVIFMKDKAGRYLHVNRQYEKLFHLCNTTMRGKTDYDVFPQDMADAFVKNDQAVIQSGQTIEVEELVPHDDGIHTYLSVKFPIRHVTGEIYAVCCIATDITKRKEAEEQIHNLAFYDALTQLPNRRLLNDRIKQAMAASKRSGLYCALLFMDLDNFKSLNDTQGHVAGDLLLTDAASRILNCVREADTVARFGGDEFLVMLSELDIDKAESIKQTTIVAEKIRNALAKPYVLTLQQESRAKVITIEHHCTASIGVVMFIGHENSVEDIVKWADIAMYKAKEGGGNLIHFYE